MLGPGHSPVAASNPLGRHGSLERERGFEPPDPRLGKATLTTAMECDGVSQTALFPAIYQAKPLCDVR
jgi:hypothetical protein